MYLWIYNSIINIYIYNIIRYIYVYKIKIKNLYKLDIVLYKFVNM